MKRFIKILCGGILAGSILLNSFTVFAESLTASRWIFDKRGSIIVDTAKNPILRESLSFGNSGVEVFDGDGNSLGKVNLERKDLYVNGTDLLLDFPNETNPPTNNNQGITVRVPIEPLYTNTTSNNSSNTSSSSNNNSLGKTATDFNGNLREVTDLRVVKVTIGSKIATVNGQNVTMDVAPYIQQKTSSTMIPLRFVATALGISENDIKFDTVTKTVTIEDRKHFDTIKFYVNSNEYNFNGYFTLIENGPVVEIKNGRTFVPLTMLKNAFSMIDRNVYTDWEPKTKTASITFEELGEKITNTNNTTTEKSTQTTTQRQTQTTTQKPTQTTTQRQTQTTTQKPTQTTTQKPTQTTTEKPTETTTQTTTQNARALEEEVVRLVNIEREKNNLQPLQIKEDLMKLARMKSEDMKNNNYFDHTSPTYGSPFDMMNQFGVSYGIAGENIASGQRTAEHVMNSWMNSPGHRANILNKSFKYIGVGFSGNLWTQMFIG